MLHLHKCECMYGLQWPLYLLHINTNFVAVGTDAFRKSNGLEVLYSTASQLHSGTHIHNCMYTLPFCSCIYNMAGDTLYTTWEGFPDTDVGERAVISHTQYNVYKI